MGEETKRILDLARMLIGLADEDHAAETLTAYIFAVAALTGTTPRSLVQRMLDGVPTDVVWNDEALPELMDGVYDDPDAPIQ